MAETTTTSFTKNQTNVQFENEAYDEDLEKFSGECKELLLSLPTEKVWASLYIYLYRGIWIPPPEIQAIHSFQKHFQAKDKDIIIASLPKSGTTWLKALVYAIVNRKHFPPSQNNHPLLISNAHDLVPFFEFNHYANNQIPDLSNLPEPRLFGTFHLLPDSIKKSQCKIIYICRNPLDQLVSLWLFIDKIIPPSLPKLSCEEALDRYSKGIHGLGPFWTHMLSYWRESKVMPKKILFLKYDDLKGDTNSYLKRVADFLEVPFNSEEESNGVIKSIIELCSFEKMKELEANKTGKFVQKFEYKDFFRKGEVGDWVNYFSPSMLEKLSKVVEEQLDGSGLSF